jgi:hypothetical protein
MKFTTTQTAILSAIASMFALGCTPMSPHLDTNFGTSLQTLRMMQTANPDASANTANPQVDGVAAKEAVGRYHKSYNAPAPQDAAGIGMTPTR